TALSGAKEGPIRAFVYNKSIVLSTIIIMDPLSVTAAILAFLETSIGIISRLRDAYSRQQTQLSLLEGHHEELQGTQNVIQVVHNEQCLHTAAMSSELAKMKDLSQNLLTFLKLLDPQEKSVPRQIAHQLTSGSRDEKKLKSISESMTAVKANIFIYIQVAAVGITRDGQSNIIANTAKIMQLDQTIRESLGDGQGLKIASLIKDQPRREDGTVVLDPDDLRKMGVSSPNGGTSRIIVGNLTRLQALQINGPIGEDEWKAVSHLEIRGNEAGAASSQVNYPVSGTVFASLLFNHFIKYILLFVLIYLPFNYFFTKN
ncbi:hypothetical protein N7495_006325, partial [Penicillium taxi]|uniref:uncharacterized protein n=1 Tax=Penicillium taxi TaxID=168475 RepID=UPI002545ACA0